MNISSDMTPDEEEALESLFQEMGAFIDKYPDKKYFLRDTLVSECNVPYNLAGQVQDAVDRHRLEKYVPDLAVLSCCYSDRARVRDLLLIDTMAPGLIHDVRRNDAFTRAAFSPLSRSEFLEILDL